MKRKGREGEEEETIRGQRKKEGNDYGKWGRERGTRSE
jgi:hypothetical protein